MSSWTPTTEVARAVYACGFEYEEKPWDIIKSRNDAWQRHTGFCWAYDIASAYLAMIIDCETFYFPYDGRVWLIELWKGQYGLETGCEIGLYRDDLGPEIRDDHDLKLLPLTGRQRYFNCVSDSERLTMWSRLRRHGDAAPLFERGPEKSWWLTGFKWGVYTKETQSLTMDLRITDFPSKEMRDSFAKAVRDKLYLPQLLGDSGIAFTFHVARTPQPASRFALASSMQRHNEHLVQLYNLYKTKNRITNNNPNNFTLPDGPLAANVRNAAATVAASKPAAAARKGAATAAAALAGPAAKARAAAASAAKKAHSVPVAAKALDAASGFIDEVTGAPEGDVVLAAYHAIHKFFEDRRAWHFTARTSA
jgi:hypothetical protein